MVKLTKLGSTKSYGLAAKGKQTVVKLCTGCPSVMVFTHPNCIHCVKFLPEVNKLKLQYANKGIHVLHYDVTRYPLVARYFRVSSYPTVYTYNPHTDDLDEYHGARTAYAIYHHAIAL